MANPQIKFNQTCVTGIGGQGAPLGSLTVSIDNYAAAYVAKVQPDNAAQCYYQVVPKTVAAGATVTVTLTFNGTSQNGTALPTVTKSYDLVGPDPAVQATALVFSPDNIGSNFQSLSTDPGTSTVVLI